MTPEFLASFYARTKLNTDTGCFEWQGAVSPTGYGKVKLEGKAVDTHRASWIVTHGEIEAGMMICHMCDNRKCVNPRHLFCGSRADNMRDAYMKGRLDDSLNAARAGRKVIITDEQIIEISARVAAGELAKDLAAEFGIADQTVSKIRHRIGARYKELLAGVTS